jgi:hypothetical protein
MSKTKLMQNWCKIGANCNSKEQEEEEEEERKQPTNQERQSHKYL